jgi:hypothetical protein
MVESMSASKAFALATLGCIQCRSANRRALRAAGVPLMMSSTPGRDVGRDFVKQPVFRAGEGSRARAPSMTVLSSAGLAGLISVTTKDIA